MKRLLSESVTNLDRAIGLKRSISFGGSAGVPKLVLARSDDALHDGEENLSSATRNSSRYNQSFFAPVSFEAIALDRLMKAGIADFCESRSRLDESCDHVRAF